MQDSVKSIRNAVLRYNFYLFKKELKELIKLFEKVLAKFITIPYNNICVQKKVPLAQLVEHLTLNQGVQGSSP
jgi:hypothetical protein